MDKIDLQFVDKNNQPDEIFMDMLERTARSDPSINKIVVMPSWHYDWLMPPSGVMVEFTANAKFQPDLFFQDLYAATTLTRVEALDEGMLDDSGERVRLAIPKSSLQPPSFHDSDKKIWTPSIGDRNCFIG